MNFHKLRKGDHIIFRPLDELENSKEKLEPGIYKCFDDGNMMQGTIPAFLELKEKENLINFSSGVVKEVIDQIKNFFSEKTIERYKDMSITHKVGLILYGPAGTGKTCCASLIMKSMVQLYQAICLDFSGQHLSFIKKSIKSIRRVQNNPIVIFYDECESYINTEEWLPFLDGNDSVDGTIFIGCTNYVNKIADRVINRKSRIKYAFEVKSLPLAVYKEFLTNKLPKMPSERITEFAFKAEANCLTIDQFKNAIIDYHIEATEIDDAIKAAKSIIEKVVLEEEEDD